jgi:hypothetical protein
LLQRFDDVVMRHVYRQENHVANELA